MKLAIMQPYIFPYIGYFQLIKSVDKFMLLDDVAYINKGWINRNRLLINGNAQFFTMPLVGASQNRSIDTIYLFQEDKWRHKLVATLTMAYKKAPEFKDFFPVVEAILYFDTNHLSSFLANSIKAICDFLDIQTTLISSTSIYKNNQLKGQDRIIDLCIKEHINTYINLSGGKSLYRREFFLDKAINLRFLRTQFQVYPQISAKEFVPALSIIDMLMNCSKGFVQDQLNQFILE